ncbi:hypothetical protein HBI46_039050 [Parastagonospora nodorum]|nr:hypothetical protein HBI71_071560 [Parastagonospora nodorum]KAH5425800.1 hypothetical protein HBI46_039050 [Parastagonospora nodorum]KAH5550212.1 hypothetical protein HBI27_019710 [Parastagonospora nodorum]KAH6236539.1 hypothetical protein HBI43_005370 [Parastagonospora nodorum]KAH6258936.1 hypothetical protein HBI42_096860 [Parastagonospora nodorum]
MSSYPTAVEWSENCQAYMRIDWSFQYQREVRERLDQTNGLPGNWIFFDWPRRDSSHNGRGAAPETLDAGYHTSSVASTSASTQQAGSRQTKRKSSIRGMFTTVNPSLHEPLDPSFMVRHGTFFTEGTVFAILFTDPMGATTQTYNSSISTQIRLFIVVASRKSLSYACPVLTYSNQGTKELGFKPQAHAVAYYEGQSPAFLDGERTLQRNLVCIVMANEPRNPPLSAPSRIHFGIDQLIKDNVKVKYIGKVKDIDMPYLLGYWKMENAYMLNNPVEAAAEGRAPNPVVLQRDPHLYHALGNPYGYDAQINQHMFHPQHNPFGYHPTKNNHGFHPHANPHMYHPTHNPNGFHKDHNRFGYHPKKNLHGYHQKDNVYGYHPSHAHLGYHPESNPQGYHVHHNLEGYHPVSNKYCYHPQQNPYGYNSRENVMGHHIQHNAYAFHPHYHRAGYHPTHNPNAYHPYYNPEAARQDESSEEEEGEGGDDDDEDEDDDEGDRPQVS